MNHDLGEIFAAQHAKALRLAYLLTGDSSAAEDVVAEAFARMARNAGRSIEHPAAYVRRAVINEVNSRWRRLARERSLHERTLHERLADDAWAQPDIGEHAADRDLVWQALRQLPDRQRAAVVLRFYADASEREAAESMGVSIGTVKSSTARGLQRLRSLLAEHAEPMPVAV